MCRGSMGERKVDGMCRPVEERLRGLSPDVLSGLEDFITKCQRVMR